MAYAVRILESAKTQLQRLPRKIQKQIAARIDALASTPRPQGSKLLYATERIYRLRSGDYRVLYEVNDEKSLITVTNIGDRKDIYRNM